MKPTIYFDMDGTIANLYAVENWLPMLRAHDPSPYAMAQPMVNMARLAKALNKLRRKGYKIGVISWCSKVSNAEYDAAVSAAKRAWLSKHLPSVVWDEINIVAYGVPKQSFCGDTIDILFDDEAPNRDNWTGQAYSEAEIFSILNSLE